jgi:hypothetical protein
MITSNMARAGHASRVVVRVDSDSAKGVWFANGLGNHDRQPRYHPVLGDRSDPRGFLGVEGTRRGLANRAGIVVETSQNQFVATTVIGVSREEFGCGWMGRYRQALINRSDGIYFVVHSGVFRTYCTITF